MNGIPIERVVGNRGTKGLLGANDADTKAVECGAIGGLKASAHAVILSLTSHDLSLT
jgi:hypothetical protein